MSSFNSALTFQLKCCFPLVGKCLDEYQGMSLCSCHLFFTNLINKSILCMVFMTFLRIAVTLYIQKHYISRNFLFFLNISAHSFGLHRQTDVAMGISLSLRVRVRVLSYRSTYTRQLDYQSVPGRIQQPRSCDTSSWLRFHSTDVYCLFDFPSKTVLLIVQYS